MLQVLFYVVCNLFRFVSLQPNPAIIHPMRTSYRHVDMNDRNWHASVPWEMGEGCRVESSDNDTLFGVTEVSPHPTNLPSCLLKYVLAHVPSISSITRAFSRSGMSPSYRKGWRLPMSMTGWCRQFFACPSRCRHQCRGQGTHNQGLARIELKLPIKTCSMREAA